MPGATSADAIAIAVEQTPDEIFDEFDTDNSGTIDAGELVRALSKAGIAMTPHKVSTLMKTIDTDGNGTISKAEFRAFVGTHKVLTMDSVVKKMESTMLNDLKQASNTADVGLAMIRHQHAMAQRQGHSAQHATARKKVCCMFLFFLALMGGILYLYIYASMIGSDYSKKDGSFKGADEDKCITGAVWVLVFGVYGLSSIVACTFAKSFAKSAHPGVPDERNPMMQKINGCNKILQTAFCGFFFWGVSIFLTDHEFMSANCEKAIWNFGYILCIVQLSLIGTVFCCVILALMKNRS